MQIIKATLEKQKLKTVGKKIKMYLIRRKHPQYTYKLQ